MEEICVIIEEMPIDWTEIFSMILAIIAIIISVITAYMQRKHNIQSVCPIMDILVGNYEDDIYVKIVNHGIGPAVIKRISCKYMDKKTSAPKESNILIELLNEEGMPTSKIKCYTNYVKNIEDRTVPPNGKIYLVRLKMGKKEDISNLRDALKNIEIVINYSDIYGNKKSSYRKLDFFGNNL